MKENYLTTESFESFLKDEYFGRMLKPCRASPSCLSLSRWEFFDPYSVIFLLLLARHANFHLEFADGHPALPYLSGIGFFDHLENRVTASHPAYGGVTKQSDFTGPLRGPSVFGSKQSRSASDILLKVTPIERSQDVTDALKGLMLTTEAILREHLSYTPQDTALFLGAFTEVAQNILDHSGDRGLAAAQVYTTKKGSRFAVIAVGDLGIGIRASLSQRYPKQFANDVIAIRRAFDPAISRLENRGWGLTQVRSITEKYHGTLWVRSGRGLVKFHRQFHSYQTSPFPGTQISISLEERRPQTKSIYSSAP